MLDKTITTFLCVGSFFLLCYVFIGLYSVNTHIKRKQFQFAMICGLIGMCCWFVAALLNIWR